MPLIRAELLLYKAKTMNDTASNGGRMSANAVVSGLAANIFPRAGETERQAGSTKYRKIFYKAAAADDSPYLNSLLFLDNHTPGADRIVMWLASQTDIQSAITGSEQRYGAGDLNVTVGAAVTSIDVAVEDWANDPIFANGMFIRISDKADIDAAGNEEIVQINAAPTPSGDIITLSFTPALAAGYSSTDTRVSSIIDYGTAVGDVVGSYDAFVVTTVGNGAFDDTTYPVGVDSIAAAEEAWTLTFTSTTAFDIVGDTLGNVGSGTIGGGASPNNADFSAPYFTLLAAGFSGVYAIGDTIAFSTHPASMPIWLKRVIPVATPAYASNKAVIATSGEG